jgi:hypothetical protein
VTSNADARLITGPRIHVAEDPAVEGLQVWDVVAARQWPSSQLQQPRGDGVVLAPGKHGRITDPEPVAKSLGARIDVRILGHRR